MNIDVKNAQAEKVGEVELPDEIAKAEVNEPLIQQAVKVYLANQRQGTAATKTRGMVSGSGRKLWKQKHTGRARVGSIRSPLWRHGGTVHGPQPRDYRMGFPKKMRQLALRSAIAAKFQEGKLLVLDQIVSDSKTKSAAAIFKTLGVASAIVLDGAENRTLRRSLQNMKKFHFVSDPVIPVYHLMRYDSLVVTVRALGSLLEALQ